MPALVIPYLNLIIGSNFKSRLKKTLILTPNLILLIN